MSPFSTSFVLIRSFGCDLHLSSIATALLRPGLSHTLLCINRTIRNDSAFQDQVALMLRLSDSQLQDWIEQNGPVPQGYGAFAAWLDLCDREHKDKLDQLRAALSSPDAPQLYFVPGTGLTDCPF